MITADSIDLNGFNAGMRGLIRKVGLNSRTVVAKETGELIKTLVKISRPPDRQKTNQSIARNVSQKFEAASHADFIDSRTSPGGIRWTRPTKKFLYGVANELDWRNESDVKKVAHLSHQLRKTGRRVLDFKHPRKRQRVSLSQRVYLQAGMLAKVIKHRQRAVGRRAAAWLDAVRQGSIGLTGGNQPPEWIKRHVTPAMRGRSENGLNTPNNPSFTLINFAKGVTARGFRAAMQSALNIRAKAMAKNALLFMKGKKNLADYAR